MNDVTKFAGIFDGLAPFDGDVPKGFLVDFLGCLTDARFRQMWGIDPETAGGGPVKTKLPELSWGEGWFEAVNWIEAARAARGRFTMVTLGACYGSQAVGAWLALQKLNPMPCRLVAVEPDPENFEWVQRHFRDNGIDPADHWLLNATISDNNAPVLFPVGAPGSGAANCVATNEPLSRRVYAQQLAKSRNTSEILHNLILEGTTGIKKDLVPGYNFMSEIKFLSAVTLRDILSPFDVVDYLESDIQQSEIIVFPPAMDILKRKVRRVHIGTHGKDVHQTLHELLVRDGWEIVFSFEPNAEFTTPLGTFSTNDGVLTAVNPALG
jgi:hypothetical protein